MTVQSLGQEDPPEKGMATHFSILAWRTHGQMNGKDDVVPIHKRILPSHKIKHI